MTDDDMADILLRWAQKRGGMFSEDDMDNLSAILEEHFVNGPGAYPREEVEARLEELGII